MTEVAHPTLVDDSGTGQDGTSVDKAYFDAYDVAINALIHDSGNATVTPADIIDEVVTARGSLASLDARLDVSLENDGTLKNQSGLVTTTQAAASVLKNLGWDTRLVLWPDGDAAAPAGFTKSGAGAVVARCGSGLGDTTSLDFSPWCTKLTYGSAAAKLTKTIVAAADYDQGWDGKKITIAVRCKASVANLASVVVDDGAGTTRGGTLGNTTYHTGDGTEGWIYVTHTISTSATKLEFYLETAQAGSAYFGAYVICWGEIVPSTYIEDRWGEFYMGIQVRGTIATGDGQGDWVGKVPRDCYYMGMAGAALTGPVGAAMTFSVEKSTDLSSWADIYSTAPDIDDGDKEIDDDARTEPDGTYANRCLKAGDYIRLNVDQVGSGTAGDDLIADFMFIVPLPELDYHKAG